MNQERIKTMREYLTVVHGFDWPESADHCETNHGGAQFFSESGEEVGFLPFFEEVWTEPDSLGRVDFLRDKLANAKALVEEIESEIAEQEIEL